MTLSVVEAKQQLAQAEAAARAGRIEEAAIQLEQVRARGRELKSQLDKLVAEIRYCDGLRLSCDREIAEYNDAIAMHVATPPMPRIFPLRKNSTSGPAIWRN